MGKKTNLHAEWWAKSQILEVSRDGKILHLCWYPTLLDAKAFLRTYSEVEVEVNVAL